MHSHKANKREVIQELGRCVHLAAETAPDTGADLRELAQIRQQLNAYVGELHMRRSPLGMSVFRIHGELARLSRLSSRSHAGIPAVLERDQDYVRRVTDLLGQLVACRAAVAAHDRHPWRGCRIEVDSPALADEIEYHFSRLAEACERLEEFASSLPQLGLLPPQPTWRAWLTAWNNAPRVMRLCAWVQPGSWKDAYTRAATLRQDLEQRLVARAFQPAHAALVTRGRAYRSFWSRWLPSWWLFKTQVRAWYKAGLPPTHLLLEDLDKLAEYHRCRSFCDQFVEKHRGDFLADASGKPSAKLTQECLRTLATMHTAGAEGGQILERLDEFVRTMESVSDSWRFVTTLFDANACISTGLVLHDSDLVGLRTWLRQRAQDAARVREWIEFGRLRRELAALGVAGIVEEICAGRLQLEEAADAFLARFYTLWLAAVYEKVPVLARFRGTAHERLIARFRHLDRSAIRSAAARIRHRVLCRADRPRALGSYIPPSSELGILLREVNKKRRHLPLRKLFADMPTVLLRLKPCLMMSPLSVSTYLQAPELSFDLVIFDEASQVRPHEAICAIYRGRQLLVAGDQRQLPPTTFFERLEQDDPDEDDAAAGGLGDFESILDVCCAVHLVRKRLRWHYRSRRESLIAFANKHIYQNELVTFPSVHDLSSQPAVVFDYLPDGRWLPGRQGGFNPVEARHTAQKVIEHFRKHPDQSLGVVALNIHQQMRILDELEHLRRHHPELEPFFQEDRSEPFFVKNLENVQGDERDVVFLSVATVRTTAGAWPCVSGLSIARAANVA